MSCSLRQRSRAISTTDQVAAEATWRGGAKVLPIHGWLVLDKPQGMTSTQAVTRVRHLYGAAKAGHAGTLDPLATGVLPIAFGEATKTVPFAVDGDKTYRFTVRFGEAPIPTMPRAR